MASKKPGRVVREYNDEALAINARLYGGDISVFNYGLSDRETTVEFTYYPRYSMMSSAFLFF